MTVDMDMESQRSLSASLASDSAMLLRVSVRGRSSHPHPIKPFETTSSSISTSTTSTSSASESFDHIAVVDLEGLEEQTGQKGVELKGKNLYRRDSGIDCSSELDLDLDLVTRNDTTATTCGKELKSKVNMLQSHQHQSQSAGTPIRFIDDADKPRYGINNKRIIATNNPTCLSGEAPLPPEDASTFAARKYISAHGDPVFTKLWEQDLGDDITHLILASLPDAEGWALAVFRLGFAQDHSNNPIVITITIDENEPAVHPAIQELISSIVALPTLRSYEKEVYVDVCRSVCRAAQANGNDYSRMNSELYSSSAPCTGYSVGPKDVHSRAGSFTCFIKHGNTIYGVTNEHVLHGTQHPYLLPTSPYALDESNPAAQKFIVAMPAVQDHIESLQSIKEEVHSNTFEEKELLQEHAVNRVNASQAPGMAAAKAYWEGVLAQRAVWNTDVGHVVATSGQDRIHSFLGWSPYQGRLDWAIFTCNTPNQVTEFPGFSLYDEGSFRGRNFHPKTRQKHDVFISTATSKFKTTCPVQQPRDNPPEENETLFKVASRTTGFREAICSGIKARFYTKANAGQPVTKEYCFISQDMTMRCSDKGDSGAIIFDQQFKPVAMIWGGTDQVYPDTTYATPLVVIMRHIEYTMGWEQGSVSLA
ncbi:hypothetical protein DL98DRAFT_599590 [Cadophora sp. DSE1049]|nr:hypothetical protein DL98DRAFT_599590 [Cadophora sp. DSE1049]